MVSETKLSTPGTLNTELWRPGVTVGDEASRPWDGGRERAGRHSDERGELADELVKEKAGRKSPTLGQRCVQRETRQPVGHTHISMAWSMEAACMVGKFCST